MADADESTKILDPSSVTYGDKIGEGGFAVVYKVQLKTKDGKIVEAAAKNIDTWNDKGEIDYLARLQHPNIITYLGYLIDEWSLTIVTELAEKGDLKSYLKSSTDPLPQTLASRWMKEAARGIQYLHHNNVVHRDIKSANFLIMADDTLKLADFGLAKNLDQTMSTLGSGTWRWLAPEVFRDLKRSKMSDIYAFAIVIWEIVCRKIPFGDLETEFGIKTAVSDGERPLIPEDCLDRFRWLMENGWHWDYQHRPTIDTIITVLETDDGKKMDEILDEMKKEEPKQNKELESQLFHPEERAEMERVRVEAENQNVNQRQEMDQLEEMKRRMRKMGREKAKKKKESRQKTH